MSAIEEWASGITVEQLDADPYPIYARMRREAPVCFVPAVGLWFVTRWADVDFAASHTDLIDSAVSPSPLNRVDGRAEHPRARRRAAEEAPSHARPVAAAPRRRGDLPGARRSDRREAPRRSRRSR